MIIAILLAYFVGSIPFALILSRRLSAQDLRQVGSGNLGAANVARVSGIGVGALVALLDMAKGAASVLLAQGLNGSPAGCAAAGFAAVVGHIYPIWLGFRGGKGVATAGGVFSVLAPLAAGFALAVFLLSVWITRYVSLGSIMATAALPPIAYATGNSTPVVASAVAAAVLIIFRHRSNVVRLRSGTERRLGAAGAVASRGLS